MAIVLVVVQERPDRTVVLPLQFDLTPDSECCGAVSRSGLTCDFPIEGHPGYHCSILASDGPGLPVKWYDVPPNVF